MHPSLELQSFVFSASCWKKKVFIEVVVSNDATITLGLFDNLYDTFVTKVIYSQSIPGDGLVMIMLFLAKM